MLSLKSIRPSLIAGLLAIVALAACSEPTTSQQAESRASELLSRLSDSDDLAVQHLAVVFGEDGAYLCAASDSVDHLSQVAFLPNSFALKKLTVTQAHVELAGIVIDVYCPENRQTFEDYVSGLEVGEARG